MPDEQCATADPVVSTVVDLRPFETPAPYFIAILKAASAQAPRVLNRTCVMDALFSLYCVDATPFRDPDRTLPVATDEHVMSVCLHAARSMYYGAEAFPSCNVRRRRRNAAG